MTVITVTADHIAHGRPGSGRECAIALALWEAFPDAEDIGVGDFATVLVGDEPEMATLLPEQAREFVRDFDDGQPVEPFTFDLDIPKAAA
jgi:hypothetical protein